MTAPRAIRARKLRRQILMVRLLTLPLPVLAFALGALAVDLSLRDGARQCLQDVNAFARGVESAPPSDPVLVSLVHRRVTEAAALCERGDRGNAREVLEALRESLRV